MTTKLPTYDSFIDSISIRINRLRVQPLFIKDYTYDQQADGTYIFKEKNNYIFTLKDQKNNDEAYQIISFNGFKKYKKRDYLIIKAFTNILNILKDNSIDYYLTKIDLAIDFYNIELEYIKNTHRLKQRGLKTNLLINLNEDQLNDIKQNKATFYLEAPVKKNSKRKQRAYIYNKSKKEKIKDNIYRFEVSLNNFNELFNDELLKNISLNILAIELTSKTYITKENKLKLKILKQSYNNTFKELLITEIQNRLDKYKVDYLGNTISFKKSIISDIVDKTVNLNGV